MYKSLKISVLIFFLHKSSFYPTMYIFREAFDKVLGNFCGSTNSAPDLPQPVTSFLVASPIVRNYDVKLDEHRLHCYCRYFKNLIIKFIKQLKLYQFII